MHPPYWGVTPGFERCILIRLRLPRAGEVSLFHRGLPRAQPQTLYSRTESGLDPASTHRLSTLCPPQKHAGFSCSSFVPDGPPERESSLPPHSPSIASPGPEQVHCPAGPGPGPFRLSPSDKYPGFGFEEGPASGPGRFLKGSHVPFHPYKRHFHEDVFPEAQTALALEGNSFKTPGALEAFEEIPEDVGEAEAFLPGFPAEVWCNGLPYPSQEHSPQVLVSTSASAHPITPVPIPSTPESLLKSNFLPSLFQTFLLRVSVHLQAQRLGVFQLHSEPPGQLREGMLTWPSVEGVRSGSLVRSRDAGSSPEAPESGFLHAASLNLNVKNPQPDLHTHT